MLPLTAPARSGVGSELWGRLHGSRALTSKQDDLCAQEHHSAVMGEDSVVLGHCWVSHRR
jgi:hypothetical protein